MANVYDVRDTDAKVLNQLRKLRAAVELRDINPDDYDAILEYFHHRKRQVSGLTQRDDLSSLRVAAERTHKPLVNYNGTHDADRHITTHQEAGVESQSGLNKYVRALRGLFEYLDERERWGDYPWGDDIPYVDFGEDDTKRYDPEDMLSGREIAALRRACTYQRDATTIEVMADAGLRVAAACQLQVRHVDRERDPPHLRVNPDAESQKSAETQGLTWIPLKDSVGQLRTWLTEGHPEAPDPHPEAPLFPVLKDYDEHEREEKAASPRTIQDQIDDAAERAGIDKPVNAHAFRHACVKRLKWKYDYDWDEIGDRLAWKPSMVSQMAQRYGRLTEEERAVKQINKLYGQETTNEDDGPTEVECWNCNRVIDADAAYCQGCGADQESDPSREELSEAVMQKATSRIAQVMLDELNRDGHDFTSVADLGGIKDELREMAGNDE